MKYYKIIQNNTVVGAGTLFLKYYEQVRMFCYCGMQEAQCVQDAATEKLYHADWLQEVPATAPQTENAIVELIDETAYDEIIAELADGEEIPVPDEPEPPAPVPEPEGETEEAPERPMTIAEMREKIQELEGVLNIIMGVVE